jgi:hypothetical protein
MGKRWARLLARVFGGGVSGDCDVCDAVVSNADLERGRAVILARRHICGGCVAYVIRHPRGRRRGGVSMDSSSTGAIEP